MTGMGEPKTWSCRVISGEVGHLQAAALSKSNFPTLQSDTVSLCSRQCFLSSLSCLLCCLEQLLCRSFLSYFLLDLHLPLTTFNALALPSPLRGICPLQHVVILLHGRLEVFNVRWYRSYCDIKRRRAKPGNGAHYSHTTTLSPPRPDHFQPFSFSLTSTQSAICI